MEQKNKILTVSNVNKFFKVRGSLKHALKNINFEVEEGDFFGIIGESGSGKTTLGKSILRLHSISGGNIHLYEKLISSKNISKKERNWICSKIQMVFQDPMSSLNPKMNIFKLVSEPLSINKSIHRKVKRLMNKKQKINSVYEHLILKELEEVSYKKFIDFFIEYKMTLSDCIENAKGFKFSNNDDWVSSFNEVDELYNNFINKMKVRLNDLSLLISDEEQIVQKYIKLPETDEELKKFIEFNVQDNSKEIEEYEIAKENLDDFKTLLKNKHQKNILSIQISDLKIQRKFHNNSKKITKTKLEYLNELIKEKACLTKYRILKNFLKISSFTEDEIKPFSSQMISKIDEYFKDVSDELFQLNESNKINESYNKILEKISKKVICNNIDKNLEEPFKKLKELNNEKEKKDKNKLLKLKELKEESHKKVLSLKNKKNNSSNPLQSKYEKIFLENKKNYESFKNSELQILSEKLNTLKKEVNSKLNEFNKVMNGHVKKLYALKPSALKEFSRREQRTIISRNKKSFKIQIETKKRTLKSIDWEYKNIREIDFINKKLCSKSKLKLWFYKSELIKILILERVYEILTSVGLKKEHTFRYPHEFSGGQRQRIVIARALINKPKLIVADEAISALDVSVQAQVINIMKDLSEKKGMTFLFIAHDLSMVRHICNKVIIMHNGLIVEKGLVSKIFENPVHPYTKSLFMAVPELNKMDIDLATFNDNSEYENEYSISNIPKFHQVSEGHEVLASNRQFNLWMK